MDWFPLLNSLRVASIATVITFLLGIWAANGITRLPCHKRRIGLYPYAAISVAADCRRVFFVKDDQP